MPTEAMTTRAAALSPRAGVALLTLQLRTSLHEAAAAEAEEAQVDQDAALAQLRAQLAPLVDERRRSLDGALERARGEAAATVAAAHAQASALVARVVTIAPGTLPPPTIEQEWPSDIALLAQQLRAAQQEAADAEAEETALDQDGARQQLLARLGPLMQERRRLLDVELAEARAEATIVVAAAHSEASAIVAKTTVSEEPVEQPAANAATIVPSTFPPPTSPPAISAAALLAPPAALPQPITVVVDAHAFAQVFATVLATILDERLPSGREARPAVTASSPAAQKRSFWSLAGHLDVLLLGVAMAIVLVILAAWLA